MFVKFVRNTFLYFKNLDCWLIIKFSYLANVLVDNPDHRSQNYKCLMSQIGGLILRKTFCI